MATSGTKIIVEIGGNIQITNTGGGSGGQVPDKIDPENKKEKNKTNTAFGTSLFDYAKKTILSSVDTSVNTNLSLSENYIGQQTLSNMKNILSKGESLVKGVAFGIATGGWVGAVVAVASWGTTQYFDFLNKRRSYYQALNAATSQTEFSQVRAGLYNDGRGTLN